MRKIFMLAIIFAASASSLAAPFKLTPARVGDTSIRRYDDADFAKSFNYLTVQKAYPDLSITPVKSIPSNAMLKEACKKAVLSILKAPGSAKFPKFSDASYSAPGGIYFIQGEVDSQNSYGALLRSPFSCTTVFEGNTKGGILWTLADLYEHH